MAAEYFLKKAVNAFPRRKSTMDLEMARTILLLSDAEDEGLDYVIKYKESLLRKGGKVSLLVYSNDKNQTAETGDYTRITIRDTNWYSKPKQAVRHLIAEHPYDLLLDLSSKDHWPLLFMAAHTNAFLRAGMFSDKKKIVHDVLLHTEDESDIKDFIEQAEYYLKIINQKS